MNIFSNSRHGDCPHDFRPFEWQFADLRTRNVYFHQFAYFIHAWKTAKNRKKYTRNLFKYKIKYNNFKLKISRCIYINRKHITRMISSLRTNQVWKTLLDTYTRTRTRTHTYCGFMCLCVLNFPIAIIPLFSMEWTNKVPQTFVIDQANESESITKHTHTHNLYCDNKIYSTALLTDFSELNFGKCFTQSTATIVNNN